MLKWNSKERGNYVWFMEKFSTYALTIQYEFGDEIALGKKLWNIHGKISAYILTIQYEFGINLKILRWNLH